MSIQHCPMTCCAADSTVTLYPLPTFSPPTPLPKAKPAMSFAINTTVEREEDDKGSKASGVPVVVTRLVVGCRRKVAVYSWKDGEPQEARVSLSAHICHINTNAFYVGSCPPTFTTKSGLSEWPHRMLWIRARLRDILSEDSHFV